MLGTVGILAVALPAIEFSLQVTLVAASVTIVLKLEARTELRVAWVMLVIVAIQNVLLLVNSRWDGTSRSKRR